MENVRPRQPYFAAAGALLALLASGCGSSHRYSQGDVKRAFQTQGFALTVGRVRGRELRKGPGVILVPKSGAPFFVAILRSDNEAASYYREFTRQKAVGTFDCLRRNVLAASDTGLSSTQRRRIQAALKALQPKSSHVRCVPPA